MKNNDALFELVKSLNKSEKRYFKLFSSLQSGENKVYLKLFDILSKATEYDEPLFIKQLAEASVARNFSNIKSYLYQLILKSMQLYSSEATVDMQLKSMLNHIAFFYKKGLYKQCKKILDKAKLTAVKYEKHLILIELLLWENRIIKNESFIGKTKEDIEKLSNEIQDAIGKQKNIAEYTMLSSQQLIIRKQYDTPRDPAMLEQYQQIMKHPLLSSEKKALSFYSLHYFYFCHINYCMLSTDFVNSYYYSNKLVQLIESHLHLTTEQESQYVSALRNLLISQLDLKKYEEMPLVIQKLKNVKTTYSDIQFFEASEMELAMYNGSGQFEQGTKVADEILNKMDNNNYIIFHQGRSMILYFTAGCVYFGAANYEKANNCINKILDEHLSDIRSDLQCFAHLLSLIIHYEKGNLDLLEYRVKTTKNFLIKRERLYKVEKIILNFLRKDIFHIHTQQELTEAFKVLKEQMLDITKDPFEKKALDYFDFISWLESKIEGKTFAEVVRGKLVEG